jgi:hypothetical protein
MASQQILQVSWNQSCLDIGIRQLEWLKAIGCGRCDENRNVECLKSRQWHEVRLRAATGENGHHHSKFLFCDEVIDVRFVISKELHDLSFCSEAEAPRDDDCGNVLWLPELLTQPLPPFFDPSKRENMLIRCGHGPEFVF